MIGLYFQHIPFPDATGWQKPDLTAVQAFLMVTGAILISTQALRARIQPDGLIYRHPHGFAYPGRSIMLFWGGRQGALAGSGGCERACPCLLARVGIAHFQREALLGHEIGRAQFTLDRRTFWLASKGNCKILPAWFRTEVLGTLRKQAVSIWMTLGLGVAAAVGAILGRVERG